MASVYILGARSAIKIMNGSIDYEHMGVLRFSTSAKGSSSMALDSESETRKPHFTATAKCRSSRGRILIGSAALEDSSLFSPRGSGTKERQRSSQDYAIVDGEVLYIKATYSQQGVLSLSLW